MRLRFGRHQRLLRKRDYTHVFREPVRLSDRCFTMLAKPGAAGTARLGLGISRRACPRAVDRNRIKRLVRESFRQQQALPPVDVVVLARPSVAALPNASLSMSLEHLWAQLRRRLRPQHDRQGNG